MSFTARVKKTGKIFDATYEVDAGGQEWLAHVLEDQMSYKGFLYDTLPTSQPNVFNCIAPQDREQKTFKGNELEKLSGTVKIRDRRKRD
jgi:hypothetical protein